MMKYFRYPDTYIISLKSKLNIIFNRKKLKDEFIPLNSLFLNKHGIEIGGPSALFSNEILPIYNVAKKIDGCNFSNQTIWEGTIDSTDYNYGKGKVGTQFILDGTNLDGISDASYDFLLSCHNLEHIANPLKALKEWSRVLKKNGTILLVLPDKRYTFDRKRPYTTFNHLVEDYKKNVEENDLTHLSEILSLHDLKMDPGAGGDFDLFKKRCELNFENRCMHHHVYSQDVLKEALSYLNFKTVAQYFIPPTNQIIVATKG